MSATQQIQTSIEHYLAEHARVAQRLPGGSYAQQTRASELTRFAEAGFPTSREEDWKYTSLQPVEKRRFEISDQPDQVSMADIQAFIPTDLDAYRIVFVDGHFMASLSALKGLPQGVTICPLSEQLQANDDEPIKAEAIDQEPGSPAAMNAAFFTDGAYMELANGAVLDRPLHILNIASGSQDERMTQIRHRYVCQTNSQAALIEHSIGLGDKAYFANQVTEAVMDCNAQLKRVRLQEESGRGYHISNFFAHQDRDSRIFNYSFDFGSRLARIDTNSRLTAQNSEIHLYGVYMPTGRQHIDNHTRVDHATEHSVSREFFRGILNEHGRGVFNGKIIIHRDAQKTDSEQACNVLLLSDKAEIDAKPELEIYADDVTAAHGSTVGRLDEDALFYLKSRGVDDDGARAILTYSFANSLVQKIGIDEIERYIEAALLSKMPGGASYADRI